MVNRSTGKAPFEIVYTKPPCCTTDLIQLPATKCKPATSLADRIAHTIAEVRAKLQETTSKYQASTNEHRRFKSFSVGDLVMVHLNKHRSPDGGSAKLKARRYGPFRILAKINDNAYVVDLPSNWHIPRTFNVADLAEYFPEEEGSAVSTSLNLGTNSAEEEGS